MQNIFTFEKLEPKNVFVDFVYARNPWMWTKLAPFFKYKMWAYWTPLSQNVQLLGLRGRRLNNES